VRLAKPSELKTIYRLFSTRRDVFPHVRQDALKRRIEARQCIFEDGVVITFQQYRKRTRVGDLDIPAGSIMLHQIINSQQGNGVGGRVFDRFFAEIVVPSGGDLYLTVRTENTVACRFYERHGMRVAGKVSWSGGTISGHIYGTAVEKYSLSIANVGPEGVEKWEEDGKRSPPRPPLRRAPCSVRATGDGRMGAQQVRTSAD